MGAALSALTRVLADNHEIFSAKINEQVGLVLACARNASPRAQVAKPLKALRDTNVGNNKNIVGTVRARVRRRGRSFAAPIAPSACGQLSKWNKQYKETEARLQKSQTACALLCRSRTPPLSLNAGSRLGFIVVALGVARRQYQSAQKAALLAADFERERGERRPAMTSSHPRPPQPRPPRASATRSSRLCSARRGWLPVWGAERRAGRRRCTPTRRRRRRKPSNCASTQPAPRAPRSRGVNVRA